MSCLRQCLQQVARDNFGILKNIKICLVFYVSADWLLFIFRCLRYSYLAVALQLYLSFTLKFDEHVQYLKWTIYKHTPER